MSRTLGRPEPNPIRARLHAREPLLGTVLTLPDVALAELVARAARLRLDRPRARRARRGATCRRSRSRRAPRRAADARAAAERRRPRVGRGRSTPAWTAWSSPRVESAAAGAPPRRPMRHPPRGIPRVRRSAARRLRGGRARGRLADPLCLVQIETAAGVEAAEQIAAVDGVDALVVGCADLALALDGDARAGARGDCARRSRACRRAAEQAGIASGIAGPDDPELLRGAGGGRSTLLVLGATSASTRGRSSTRLRRARGEEGCVSAPEAWHVTRTLRAMELLAVRAAVGAGARRRRSGVHVRTARRVLKRLESEGYVMLSDDRRRRYRPTMRVVALAGQVVERAELTLTAVPHVTRAARASSDGAATCACRATCSRSASSTTPATCGSGCRPHLRELVPCHCTAAGKALLAWREGWREAVLAEPLDVVHRAHDHRPRVAAPRARPHRRARATRSRTGSTSPTPAGSRRPCSTRPARPWPRWPWSRRPTLPADRYGEVGASVMARRRGALARARLRRPAARPGRVAWPTTSSEPRPAPASVERGRAADRRRDARRHRARAARTAVRDWSRAPRRLGARLVRWSSADRGRGGRGRSSGRDLQRAHRVRAGAVRDFAERQLDDARRSPGRDAAAACGSATATCRSARSAPTCRAAATRCSPRRS